MRFLRADAVVLAGVRRTAFEARLPSLTRLARTVPVFVAGEGAKALADPPAALTVLPDDLVAAAELVDARVPAAEVLDDARRAAADGAEHALG